MTCSHVGLGSVSFFNSNLYAVVTRVVFARGTGGRALVTEFQGMALNGLFCADVLQPLDLVPLTDFTYKYHPGYNYDSTAMQRHSTSSVRVDRIYRQSKGIWLWL